MAAKVLYFRLFQHSLNHQELFNFLLLYFDLLHHRSNQQYRSFRQFLLSRSTDQIPWVQIIFVR